MTLALSLVSGSVLVHTSDRLVTAGGQPWDPLANKTVVVIGREGLGCLGYSGSAHVGDQPTDEWLAELVSETKTQSLIGAPAMQFRPGFLPSLGLSLRRVARALERDFPQQPARRVQAGLSGLAAGFLIKRVHSPSPRVRPFLSLYSFDGGTGAFTSDALPRYWEWHRRSSLGHVGVYAPEKAEVMNALAGGGKDQDDVESMLVECIRSVSSRDPGVGADCICVVMSPDSDIRVRFLPDPTNDQGQVAYTPWIIGPGAIVPPQVMWGAASPRLQLGALPVLFDRIPPLTERGGAGTFGQPRRPPP
jgi:hypothetical protein